MRLGVTTAVAIIAMAASVLIASHAQRTTAARHNREQQVILTLLSDTNRAEAAASTFGLTGDTGQLAEHSTAVSRLQSDIEDAGRVAGDDKIQRQAVAEQLQISHRLAALLDPKLSKAAVREQQLAVRKVAGEAHRLTNRLLASARQLQARQAVITRREDRHAAVVAPLLIVLLGLTFGGAAGVVQFRASRSARRRARRRDQQQRFGEALQVSVSQPEAHGLLKGYLERTLPGIDVTILNRNNSADRLEAATEVPQTSPLFEVLQRARPRSCMAVRLSRPFGQGAAGEELPCEICGALAAETTCQPLLVGGEVIGSVLTRHESAPERDAADRIAASISQAAPVLANLRNLALAETRAATDALTGLPNRRAVDETLLRMLAQAGRAITPLSVVMLDLDHFKHINDTYGHDRGDEVLAAVSARMREVLRASDFVGRTGGEEFVMFLPDTDRTGAVELAEKLRLSLHDLTVHGVERAITASFGVACYPDDAVTGETLLRGADRALYAAKRGGRDRVEVCGPSSAPSNVV